MSDVILQTSECHSCGSPQHASSHSFYPQREADVRNDALRTEAGRKKTTPATFLGVSAFSVIVIAGAGLLAAWMIGTAAFLAWGGG